MRFLSSLMFAAAFRVLIGGLSADILFALPAAAQLTLQSAQLTAAQDAYLGSPAHLNAATDQLRKSVAAAFPGCAQFSAKPGPILFSQTLVMTAAGEPASGAWKELREVTGCGVTRILNFYWGVDTGGVVHVVSGLNGSTAADLALQSDAVTVAGHFLAGKFPVCKTPAVVDTRFEKTLPPTHMPPPAPATQKTENHWSETWLVDAGGRSYDLPMEFFTGVDGGSAITPKINEMREEK